MSEDFYACSYFDGITSRGYKARAACLPEYIAVEYVDENGESRKVFWESNDIRVVQSSGGSGVRLEYGKFPRQGITVMSREFMADFRKSVRRAGPVEAVYEFFLKNRIRIAGAVILIAGFLVSAYFFVVPLFADFAAQNIPYEQERVLGNTLFSALHDNLLLDPEATGRLREFSGTLRYDGPAPEVHVSSLKVVNAFAMMGGHIVVYKPMLELIRTPDQLAALLAHEYAHVRKHHSTRLLFRSLSGFIIISSLLNDFSGIAAGVLQAGDGLMKMSYSRAFEREADAEALRLLAANGYSGEALAELFELISESGAQDAPEWMSTHPMLVNRIREVRSGSHTAPAGAVDSGTFEAFMKLMKPFSGE